MMDQDQIRKKIEDLETLKASVKAMKETNTWYRPYVLYLRRKYGLVNGQQHPFVQKWCKSVLFCQQTTIEVEERLQPLRNQLWED